METPVAPTVQTPQPTDTPKVLTSMGSVFGTQLTGFALVNEQSGPQPTTAERKAAVMPTDVLTQDVMTLQSEVKALKMEVEALRAQVKDMVKPVEVMTVEKILKDGIDKQHLACGLESPLAPEKKKMGRPKKVSA